MNFEDTTVSQGSGSVSTEEATSDVDGSAEETSPSSDGTAHGTANDKEVVSGEEAEEATGEEAGSSPEDAFTGVNPDELPDELKAIYKQLQSDYVAKTQDVAELRRKAQLFEELQSQNLVETKVPKSDQQAAIQSAIGEHLAKEMGVNYSSLTPAERSTYDALASAVSKITEQAVEQAISPITQTMRKKDVETELQQVKAKYPDFDQYTDKIAEVLHGNPSMTYEHAYQLATYEAQAAKGRAEALANLKKKQDQAPTKVKGVGGSGAKIDSGDGIKSGSSVADIARQLLMGKA